MRHNYVGDVGDYAKLAFLRELSVGLPSRVQLGVNWYLTAHPEQNGDGGRRPHLRSPATWRSLDPDLLHRLQALELKVGAGAPRTVSLLEGPGILPPGTKCFADPLPLRSLPRSERTFRRDEWHLNALSRLSAAHVVFLDPDNGIEVSSCPPTSPSADKYAFLSEIAAYLRLGQQVLVYQHKPRVTWASMIARIATLVSDALPPSTELAVVGSSGHGERAFIGLGTASWFGEALRATVATLADRLTHSRQPRFLCWHYP